jgi:hypothetical protein
MSVARQQLYVDDDRVDRAAIEGVKSAVDPNATTVRIPTASRQRAAASTNAASSSTNSTKIDPPTAPPEISRMRPRIFIPWPGVAKITQVKNKHRLPPHGRDRCAPLGGGSRRRLSQAAMNAQPDLPLITRWFGSRALRYRGWPFGTAMASAAPASARNAPVQTHSSIGHLSASKYPKGEAPAALAVPAPIAIAASPIPFIGRTIAYSVPQCTTGKILKGLPSEIFRSPVSPALGLAAQPLKTIAIVTAPPLNGWPFVRLAVPTPDRCAEIIQVASELVVVSCSVHDHAGPRASDMIGIQRYTLALASACCLAATVAPAQAPMTLDFSWHGISGCLGGVRSPAFQVRNAPAETHRLSFTLFRNQAEYGGDQTAYPASGDVAAGLIYTNGPCQPGDYRWTVVALDRLGRALASADKIRPFP